MRVGPWLVTSELVPELLVATETNADSLLEAKAIKSMDKFMDGCIEYHVKTPCCSSQGGSDDANPRPLVFCGEYNRQSRPQAWKKSDLKIQSTLPLLGYDKEAVKAMTDAETHSWVLVRVTITRDGAECSAGGDGSLTETKQATDCEDERNA